MTVYRLGEIVLVAFPHTDLQGISKRPAIVLYDSNDQDVVVARITTQEYNTDADYRIYDWKTCGLLAESYIRLGKLATIEKRYIAKKLGGLSAAELEDIKSILKKIFSL